MRDVKLVCVESWVLLYFTLGYKLNSYSALRLNPVFSAAGVRAPATKVRQNLSIVAKNENSTEHFVHLHADYLTPWGPKNNNTIGPVNIVMKNTLCELN